MPKDKLLGMINNDNKRYRNSLFKSKKEETKKVFISQQGRVFLNKKEKKLKKVLTSQQKRIFSNQK